MAEYEDIVNNFISEIEKNIAVVGKEYTDGVYKIHISKYLIYIYLPRVTRQEVASEIPIIHIDIDLILNDKSKIVKRLSGMCGFGQRVYARNTVVARVDKKNALEFLTEHHLQISLPGKYRYGLFHNGELVSLAVFSGGRLMKDEYPGYRSFELIRFCHKGDLLVVGGLSKLIKAFVMDFKPQDIMTYSDLDWAERSSLESIGFKVVGQLAPQKFYVDNNRRYQNLSNCTNEIYEVQNKGSLKLKLIL